MDSKNRASPPVTAAKQPCRQHRRSRRSAASIRRRSSPVPTSPHRVLFGNVRYPTSADNCPGQIHCLAVDHDGKTERQPGADPGDGLITQSVRQTHRARSRGPISIGQSSTAARGRVRSPTGRPSLTERFVSGLKARVDKSIGPAPLGDARPSLPGQRVGGDPGGRRLPTVRAPRTRRSATCPRQ